MRMTSRAVEIDLHKDDSESVAGFVGHYSSLGIFKDKKELLRALKEHRNSLFDQLLDLEQALVELSIEVPEREQMTV